MKYTRPARENSRKDARWPLRLSSGRPLSKFHHFWGLYSKSGTGRVMARAFRAIVRCVLRRMNDRHEERRQPAGLPSVTTTGRHLAAWVDERREVGGSGR